MRKGGRWAVLFGFLALVSCGTVSEGIGVPMAEAPGAQAPVAAESAAATAAPAPTRATATPEELRLYQMIMDYRASKGLPEIPLSPSLTRVAQIHVREGPRGPLPSRGRV